MKIRLTEDIIDEYYNVHFERNTWVKVLDKYQQHNQKKGSKIIAVHGHGVYTVAKEGQYLLESEVIDRKNLEKLGFEYTYTSPGHTVGSGENAYHPTSNYRMAVRDSLMGEDYHDWIVISTYESRDGVSYSLKIKYQSDVTADDSYSKGDTAYYEAAYFPEWTVRDVPIKTIEDLKTLLKLLKVPKFM